MFQQSHFRIAKGKATGRKVRAFTVIELMLAVAIMGVIIYALYSVFNQTQRALRRSETDVDVSQRARAVLEMLSRELEQAQPTLGFWMQTDGSTRYPTNEINMLGGPEFPPSVQRIADRPEIEARTNYLHRIFFYNNKTNAWQGIGYRITYFTNGVGVLQRFETNQFGHRPISNRLARAFLNENLTNFTYRHVADGVIHLSFVPYDAHGKRLGWDTTNGLSALNTMDTNRISTYKVARWNVGGELITRSSDVDDLAEPTSTNGLNMTTVELREAFDDQNEQYVTTFNFRSNALPHYIEVELGMLEPQTLELYYTMLKDENPNAATFLARQINRVHLFRQRIPIRAAGNYLQNNAVAAAVAAGGGR